MLSVCLSVCDKELLEFVGCTFSFCIVNFCSPIGCESRLLTEVNAREMKEILLVIDRRHR